MRIKHIFPIFCAIAVATAALLTDTVTAATDTSEIQKRFNAETIKRPFSVPSDAELTKALDDATKRGQPSYQSRSNLGGCVGLGCAWGRNFGYGSYFGGYSRPYYGGYYGINNYMPYYYGW